MSKFTLVSGSTPPTPAAGRVTVYPDSADKHLKTIDDTGTVEDLVSAVGTHDLGGAEHTADSLANLNAKITGGDLDFDTASRPPSGAAGGDLGGTYPNPTVDDGADGTAIHDDTAGEISAVTLKATPAGADHVLIEDSAAADAKKRTTASAIAASGPPAAHVHTHTSTTGQTANDHHNQVHSVDGADHTFPGGATTYLDGDGNFTVPGGAGGAVMFLWRFSTNTTASDPGSGNFRMNSATPASVTNLYVDDLTQGAGLDVSNFFADLEVGEEIAIQQADDATKVILFEISSAPVDNTGWWTIPVTVVDDVGGLFGNNKDCAFVFHTGLATHAFGGSAHSADTLANVNAKISDATLDDSASSRPPSGTAGGDLGGTYPNPTVDDGADGTAIHDDTAAEISAITLKASPVAADHVLIEDSASADAKKRTTAGAIAASGPPAAHTHTHASTTGQTADDHHNQQHGLGAAADHTSATIAQLNALVSDATLDDSSASRPPSGTAGGDLGGTYPNPTVDDGADGTAIHDDTAAEISAITLKASPAGADHVLIEDSAAADAKKRTTAAAIAASGPPAAHVHTHASTTGQTEDDHHNRQHGLGTAADHTSATIAQLNALVSDATLDDSASSRPPSGSASGDLGGSYPSPTVTDLTMASEAHGDVLIRGSTGWKRLAPDDGKVLVSNGASADPSWESVRGQLGYTISGTLTTGADKAFAFRPSGNFTVTEVFIEVKTAPTGASIIVDVNVGGTTIFTTQANRPTISAGSKTGTSGVPDLPNLVKNSAITIDVDQIGSVVAGADMTIHVRGNLVL